MSLFSLKYKTEEYGIGASGGHVSCHLERRGGEAEGEGHTLV